MNELIQKLKIKEEKLKESIAKIRGILELDRDKIKADEAFFNELIGRHAEVLQMLKDLEEKK